MIVFAAIAPHGDLDEIPELRAAMEELGRRFDGAGARHRVRRHPAQRARRGPLRGRHRSARGGVGRWTARLPTELLRADLPILGVLVRRQRLPEQAEMPLDWGTEVPLRYLRAPRIVVVSPARDLPLADHIRSARRSPQAPGPPTRSSRAPTTGTRTTRMGRTAIDPAAADYDELLQEILASERLDFLPLAALADDAKADSLWQLLVLQGALGRRRGPTSSPTPALATTGCSSRRFLASAGRRTPAWRPRSARAGCARRRSGRSARGIVTDTTRELWGLGLVALGVFLGTVRYAGWNGGYVGRALVDGFDGARRRRLVGAAGPARRARRADGGAQRARRRPPVPDRSGGRLGRAHDRSRTRPRRLRRPRARRAVGARSAPRAPRSSACCCSSSATLLLSGASLGAILRRSGTAMSGRWRRKRARDDASPRPQRLPLGPEDDASGRGRAKRRTRTS